jgi:hypothetical protein
MAAAVVHRYLRRRKAGIGEGADRHEHFVVDVVSYE